MSNDPDFAEPIVAKAGGPWVDEALTRRWVWACLVNSIVPFLLGLAVTSGLARGGMVLGVAAVVWFGRSLAGTFPELVRTVVYGGWVVALAQLVPVLQVMAGVAAVVAVERIGLGSEERQHSAIDGLTGGFLATIGTGGLLIAAAGMIGLVGRTIVYLVRRAEYGAQGWQTVPMSKEA